MALATRHASTAFVTAEGAMAATRVGELSRDGLEPLLGGHVGLNSGSSLTLQRLSSFEAALEAQLQVQVMQFERDRRRGPGLLGLMPGDSALDVGCQLGEHQRQDIGEMVAAAKRAGVTIPPPGVTWDVHGASETGEMDHAEQP